MPTPTTLSNAPDASLAVARVWSVILFFLLITPACHTAAESLASGPVELAARAGSVVKFSLAKSVTAQFEARQPICLQLLTKEGTAYWLSRW